MTYCFVFICQGGRLEWMAGLLAASLREYLRCDYEIVVAIPDYAEVELPQNSTLDFFDSLQIRSIRINNAVNNLYPIGNKLSCIDVDTDADKVVFLDSDMLCVSEFFHAAEFEQFDFLAKLTDLADLSLEDWQFVYRAVGFDLPEELLRATVSGETIPLCFNAGFIAVDRKLNLGATWIEFARRLDSIENLPGARPFLDQLSLPFAVRKLGARVELLDEKYNYPSEIRSVDAGNPPIFSHYHNSAFLLSERMHTDLITKLVKKYRIASYLTFPRPLEALVT